MKNIDSKLKQYDVVEILRIKKLKDFSLTDGINRREPKVGDIAVIIEIYTNPYLGYELECSDNDGVPYWMHAFSPEDIELKVIKRLIA